MPGIQIEIATENGFRPGIREVHGAIVRTPGKPIRYRQAANYLAALAAGIQPVQRRSAGKPVFMECPRPEAAAAIAPSIVKSHGGPFQVYAGKFVYFAGAKIDGGKTRSQRGYSTARIPKGKRANVLGHWPGLTSAGGGVEAMYRRLLDIDPVEHSVYVAPNRRFTQESRD